VEDVAEGSRGPVKGDDERGALEALISEIHQGDDAFPEADALSALAVNIERLGLAGQFEYNTVKDIADVGRRNRHAFSVGQSLEPVLREQREEEIQGIFGRFAVAAYGVAVTIVRGQRGRGKLGRRKRRLVATGDILGSDRGGI